MMERIYFLKLGVIASGCKNVITYKGVCVCMQACLSTVFCVYQL